MNPSAYTCLGLSGKRKEFQETQEEKKKHTTFPQGMVSRVGFDAREGREKKKKEEKRK